MPGLAYTLGMEAGPAIAGVNAFKGALGGLHGAIGKITGVLGVLGVSFAAFQGASSFFESIKGVMEAGNELNTMRAVTGQTIKEIVTMKKAFGEVGIAPEAFEGSLIRLQKSLGGVNEEGVPTGHIFEQLGLSINKLKGEGAVEMFKEIGSAINKLGSDADRTFAVMNIFGRDGAPLKALFGDPSVIDEAGKSMAGYGAIMERDAGLFKDITNVLEGLHSKVKGFFVGFADKIAPVLLPLLQSLKDSMGVFLGLGQRIGGEIAAISKSMYGLFKNGDMGEAAGLSLRVGFADAVDFLATKLTTVFDSISKTMPGLVESIGNIFGALKDTFIGLGKILVGTIAKGLASSLRDVGFMGKPLVSNDKLNTLNMVGNDLQDEGAAQIKEPLAVLMSSIGEKLAPLLGVTKGDLDEARKRKAELYAKADVTAEKNGVGVPPVAPVMRKDTGGSLLGISDIEAPKTKEMRIEPLSDRLAKIGLFIGGNGGVKGQKAQEDTAKNTRHIAEAVRKTNEILSNSKHSWHATF